MDLVEECVHNLSDHLDVAINSPPGPDLDDKAEYVLRFLGLPSDQRHALLEELSADERWARSPGSSAACDLSMSDPSTRRQATSL